VINSGGVPKQTLSLVYLRASQLNGCSFCVDMHSRDLKEGGESDERLWGVGAWRESPHFNDAERAALALTEAATRLSDRADPVPDPLWQEAARHYDERALAARPGDQRDQPVEPDQRDNAPNGRRGPGARRRRQVM
jgi:AhpD family alkylhydroperoxidase